MRGGGKLLNFDEFAVLDFFISPRQIFDCRVGFFAARIIHQTIFLQRTIEDFLLLDEPRHQRHRRIPRVHQTEPKLDLSQLEQVKHFGNVVEFGFAVSVGVKEAIIQHPKAVNLRVVINAVDQADAFDDGVFVARILTANAFDGERIGFVQNRIIEDNRSRRRENHLVFDLLPEQTRGKFVGFQIAIDAVVVKVFKMLRQICASIIDLAGEQILTIKLACCFHASNFNQIYTFEKVL